MKRINEPWAPVKMPSPFPCELSDGRVVVDELCLCGFNRSEHEPGGGGAFGHGPCSVSGCDKFSWAGHVFAPAKEG
jgi:hypothetical protein